jgi:hypothetical protein
MRYCDHCQSELSERRFFLSRSVEIYRDSNEEEIDRIRVLYSDILHQFCCAGRQYEHSKLLESLGIKKLAPDLSDETCAKCNGWVDLTAPQVAYSLMEASHVPHTWASTFGCS